MMLLRSSAGTPLDVGLRAELRTGDADDAQPLLVHLDVLADRASAPNSAAAPPSPSTATGAARCLVLVEEAALGEPQDAGSADVRRLDAVDRRHVATGFGDQLRGRKRLRAVDASMPVMLARMTR